MCECFALARALGRGRMLVVVIAASFFCAGAALAEDKEPLAIVELGAAGERGLTNGGSGFGPTAAIEFTPIKNWLEIEVGLTRLFSSDQREWDTDLIFKKPFNMSPTLELEPGIGPVWIRTAAGGRSINAVGAEAVLDFMFWPTPDRKFGWFLEPGYSYSFGRDHERSLGVSGGLLIPIP